MKTLILKSVLLSLGITAVVWSFILGYNDTAWSDVQIVSMQYIGFFLLASVLCMAIVLLVSKKNFDQTGMSFLVVTTVKMVPAFLLIKYGREQINETLAIQMGYSGFLLFLAIEVYFTYRLLNNKQKKD
jgi:hypothetical protein